MAFVDGQNLFQHAKDAFGHYHPNYDLKKLHNAVCAEHGWTPNLVRFYTGVPTADHEPMWAGYWSSRIIAMQRAGIHVTKRRLRYRPVEHPDGSIKFAPQEKGIDVRLALDVVKLARKRNYSVAVLYSQDQDLAEVVDEVREIAREQNRQIQICCAFPGGPNATSRRGVDRTQWFRMTEAFYNQCIDPRDYRPQQYR